MFKTTVTHIVGILLLFHKATSVVSGSWDVVHFGLNVAALSQSHGHIGTSVVWKEGAFVHVASGVF